MSTMYIVVFPLAHLEDLSEDDVLPVQPGRLLDRDEELAAVGVLARVRHAQPALAVVLQLEVLVVEAVAKDGASAGACKNTRSR